jgi:hypothetical protein
MSKERAAGIANSPNAIDGSIGKIDAAMTPVVRHWTALNPGVPGSGQGRDRDLDGFALRRTGPSRRGSR